MASGLYDNGRQSFGQGAIDWENDNIDLLLVDDTYTFDPLDEVVSDLTVSELSATDYARKDVTGRTVTDSSPTNFLMSNVVFAGLGGALNDTIGGAVVFKNLGADASNVLICFVDTADILTQDTDVTIAIAGGVAFTWAG